MVTQYDFKTYSPNEDGKYGFLRIFEKTKTFHLGHCDYDACRISWQDYREILRNLYSKGYKEV